MEYLIAVGLGAVAYIALIKKLKVVPIKGKK